MSQTRAAAWQRLRTGSGGRRRSGRRCGRRRTLRGELMQKSCVTAAVSPGPASHRHAALLAVRAVQPASVFLLLLHCSVSTRD